MGKQTKMQKHHIAILHLDCAGCNVKGQPHANNNHSAQTLCQTNLQIKNESFHVLSSLHSLSFPSLSPTTIQTKKSTFKNISYFVCSWAPKGLQYIGTMPNQEMQYNNSNSALLLREVSMAKLSLILSFHVQDVGLCHVPRGFAIQKSKVKYQKQLALIHNSTLNMAKCNCANQI